MYRKRTKNTQENTGNSKKRRLKYELYDSRFHKSYNNIKTGNYDDNNMLMDGGSSAPASEKKEIFYDDKNEVHNFLEKWFKHTENKYKPDNKLDIGKLIKNFKITVSNEDTDTDTNTDNLLLTLFKKFLNNNEEQLSNLSTQNSFNTTNYIDTIITQINKEENNTIAVFKYDLYLYNLDSILKKYKTAENTNVFTNFLKTLNIEKHIENTKKIFQFDKKSFSNADATNDSKKIIMYIPKFLKKIKSGINTLQGGAKNEPYDISKLKELENSTKTTENKSIRTEFKNNDLWNTVLNTDKTKHYGFVDVIPKNLLSQEFTLSVEDDKKQIQKYLDKCNDLQYLYINKHIELLEIFKLINIYTKHNDNINKIIKKLVDPKYYNIKGENDNIDGVVKLLPLLNMGDLSKTPSITDLEHKLSGKQSGGVDDTYNVSKDTLKNLTKKDDDFFKKNKTYEFIRKNEENETETVIMTVSDITDPDITFKNIKTQNNSELDTFFSQDTGYLETKDTTDEEESENKQEQKSKSKPIIDVKEVNHIVSIDDYEFLQLIKQIQLSNEKSIKQILGENPDFKKVTIDDLIKNFKQGSKPYTNQNGNNNKWKSFSIYNNNNFYFNNSNSKKTSIDRKSSKEIDVIQKVIYNCYDLQILYLVKHIEVVEMFKLLYYYYDMMIKKIGILFFILSLYSKSNINITDIILDNSIFLPVGKIIQPAVNSNILSGVSIGGGGNDDIEDILTKLNAVVENKYNTTKTEHKTKVLTKIKKFNSENVTDEQLTLLFNNLLTYFKKFSQDKDSINKYDYIDKLLIKLLKKIIPKIIDKNEKISNEKISNEKISNEKQKEEIFNVMEQIVYDIKNKEIQIQQEQDRVKKNKSPTSTSSYGVKAGQFSKMDFEISKTINKYFSKIFDYGIKKVIGDGKEGETNLDKITSLMLDARKLIGEFSDKSNTNVKSKNNQNTLETKITEIEVEMIKLFEQTKKFVYIVNAIENNKKFNDDDIPTSEEDPLHIKTSLFEEYRLNFLELLKNVYFPKDKSINFENIIVEKEKKLLNNVLNRVRYKGQTIEGKNDKSNVIYIKQIAFEVLKNQEEELENKKKDDEAERLEAERLKAERLEAERLEAERLEAERQRLEAEEERKRLKERQATDAKTAEENAQKEAEKKQSIIKKIQYMMDLYNTKKEDEKINSDLKAYTIQLLDNATVINGLKLLTEDKWWKNRKSENEITTPTPEDINIYNTHYSQLLSILQGSALIYVNLKPKQGGGNTQKKLFDVYYNEKKIKLKDLCKDKKEKKNNKFGFDVDEPHGPYELVFPEKINKNEEIYQTLFDSNENEPRTVKFNVEETDTELQKQGLMKSIENGKSFVLFGFGFSGSGKTYTLIEGGENDTSILYQFINKNKEKINCVEFLEIYPDPDKPTFFVGTDKEKELSDIIIPNKNNEIKKNKIYATITKSDDASISIEDVEKQIAEIEKHRRDQLRILPTSNNPNSSRSFLQITIKMAKGGQLVIFDMPGTESTVRIKEMMLGKKSYVDKKLTECNDFDDKNIQDCFKFNENAKDYFLQGSIDKFKIKEQEPKTINPFNITLCKILHKLLTYKSHPIDSGGGCAISNLFEGFDDTIKNYHINNGNIYTLVTIKYTKQNDNSYTISSVQTVIDKYEENKKNTKIIMNVLFKYFILNIFKFWHLGIKLPLYTIERTECDKYIAKIGFELACFFNKKAYSTYDDYFKQTILDEIVFLKDEDYKNIYDQFLKVILISENFSKTDSDISLSDNISNEEQKIKMMEVFDFKIDDEGSIKFTLNNEVFTQTLENIKQLDAKFFINNTHTKSIFIKYILFILSYIKQNSETLKTTVLEKIYNNNEKFNENNIVLEKTVKIPKVTNPTYEKPSLPKAMDNINIKNYAYEKTIYDIENMRLRASVYFIYKYIKFIVNQGSGIMTTLEHLKFFFLSRAGKIKKYNDMVEKSKVFTIENGKDIFNNEVTYTNKEGEIEEKINIGQMKKYGLISILQSLAGDETDLEKISKNKLEGTMIPNLLTPKKKTEAQSAEQHKNTTKSKFIMLAHINPFPNTDEDEEKQKKCKSASDTLAYIDNISANNLGVLTRGGGYRKKKYYKDINSSLLPTLKQHRIKRFTTLKKLNKNKKNLFTSKTKKLL